MRKRTASQRVQLFRFDTSHVIQKMLEQLVHGIGYVKEVGMEVGTGHKLPELKHPLV